jgi:hypothetical protein
MQVVEGTASVSGTAGSSSKEVCMSDSTDAVTIKEYTIT